MDATENNLPHHKSTSNIRSPPSTSLNNKTEISESVKYKPTLGYIRKIVSAVCKIFRWRYREVSSLLPLVPPSLSS